MSEDNMAICWGYVQEVVVNSLTNRLRGFKELSEIDAKELVDEVIQDVIGEGNRVDGAELEGCDILIQRSKNKEETNNDKRPELEQKRDRLEEKQRELRYELEEKKAYLKEKKQEALLKIEVQQVKLEKLKQKLSEEKNND